MLLLAVSALEKAGKVPIRTWVNIALIIGGFFLLVFLIRKAADMNKILLSAIIFVVVAIVGFHWVYERNEPAFLTPFVEYVAPFLPSAGKTQG